MQAFEIVESRSPLLGANADDEGVGFALFSSVASGVDLCLFDPGGTQEIARLALPTCENEIWSGYVPGLRAGQRYGYRVHGRYDPAAGLRCNPNKLLIDPYARQLTGGIVLSDAHFGYDRAAEGDRDLTFSRLDSAGVTPKCIVCGDLDGGPGPSAPVIGWDRTILYELHVDGFSRLHPAGGAAGLAPCEALAAPELVAHVRSLGVTSVELLPVHAFADDYPLVAKGLRNYWGYNSVGFFAPAPRYLGPQGLRSFRDMVRRFHDAGIEVILDVVYNHTAESDELGPTLSFRGIDNAAYYQLQPQDPRRYVNNAGTGNTLRAEHPRVIALVLDSLRYWAQVMEVDGFRFDLAASLARKDGPFDAHAPLLSAIAQDPVLRRLKCIAEPWDARAEGYALGAFPPGWAEWNDRYRDRVRAYWRGDPGSARGLAESLAGSPGTFDHHGRAPWASVNFVTAHDGFTLRDLVSYDRKHNEANGEDNRDGQDDNRSWNCGWEGETGDPAVNALRERQMRNMLATLLLSHGTPMVLAGDEIGRSQGGNNNAYCQDGPINWLDWNALSSRYQGLLAFARRLIGLRRQQGLFRPPRYGDVVLHWLNAGGGEQEPAHWADASALAFGCLMTAEAGGPESLILFNSYADTVRFQLPPRGGGQPWTLVVDTADPEARVGASGIAEAIEVGGRSLMVLT